VSSPLTSISPLDGRYSGSVKELAVCFSESALMRYRLKVEIEYLIFLGSERSIKELPPFSRAEMARLRKIYLNFNSDGAKKIKQIEGSTNHDVKAIEYYVQGKIKKTLRPWVHFALTSEDVNNLSYALMWHDGLNQVYMPMLLSINRALKKLSKKYKNISVLSLTHGQPATPTTFGKELAVFSVRLDRQIQQIKTHKLLGKLGGSTGTWSAHVVAYQKTGWVNFASNFIKSLGLYPNLVTTQVEPHDSTAESYHQVVRLNLILTDLCRDMWFYISRGILEQKKVNHEVGSSIMPHKINPIQFENAEGNLGVSSALLNHLANKLPVSRMQRDLTDSTALRNQGVALGHSYLAVKNILKGLNRIRINKTQIAKELDSHWEVLAEAVQTVLRKNGKQDAYEQLKTLTRGQPVNAESIKKFVLELGLPDKDKDALLKLTPKLYTGLASQLVGLV